MKYGLLGKTLGHSYSPEIHISLGSVPYEKVELQENELEHFFRAKDFNGINVTVPYKESVIKYLDCLSDTANKIGAVNTIKNENGKLVGYNTDYFGLKYTIQKLGVNVSGLTTVVLGTGGASKCAVKLLNDLGAKEVLTVSRTGELNYESVKLRSDIEYIVNATPVGMYKSAGECLIDLKYFTNLKGVVDLIYNPQITELLFRAKSLNIPCINGLSMLVAQAVKSAEIWLNKTFSNDIIESIIFALQSQIENVVLIGMPGSGKSTVGKALASYLSKPFYDSDIEFYNTFGITPKDCIESEGEKAFRQKESIVIKELSQKSGIVLATGGGAILCEENRKCLKSNGKILYLHRDISKLATENRPLSTNLTKLFNERKGIYESFSDITLTDGSINQVVKQALNFLIKE
ncbi:MAG: shikimate kinase [Clostridia bacterium]|nr:shikimate kinase [Clostridia bacterium]